MAQIGYISINGATQGKITSDASTAKSVGNIWQDGHKDESIVLGFAGAAIIPRDPSSGTAIGARRHEPAKFLKPIDKASPLLWQALTTGENLEVELKLFRTSIDGKQEHYYTIKWTDAVLVEGRAMLPDTTDAANESRGHQEEWAFTYRKAEWTHVAAGTSAADDWRAPVV